MIGAPSGTSKNIGINDIRALLGTSTRAPFGHLKALACPERPHYLNRPTRKESESRQHPAAFVGSVRSSTHEAIDHDETFPPALRVTASATPR